LCALWARTHSCSGVVTFAPSASGHAVPLSTIPVNTSDLEGVTLGISPDATERLFIADTDNARVLEYANPVHAPRQVTTLQTGITYPTGLATDAIGDLYVLDGYGCGSNSVNVYGPNSGPQTAPLRRMTFDINSDYAQGLAYRDGYLFTYQACSSPERLQLYDPAASGPTSPLYQLEIEDGTAFSVGP